MEPNLPKQTPKAKGKRQRSPDHLRRIEVREKSGLTPEQVAKRMHISVSYYKRIEREGCDCYDRACRMARFFGVPLDTYLWR